MGIKQRHAFKITIYFKMFNFVFGLPSPWLGVPGYNHTSLLINNVGRGPRQDRVVEDFSQLEQDAGRAWFLPEHGDTQFTGNVSSLLLFLLLFFQAILDV